MAQAARLNLRMHKELKLLLTDPPPGASFPSLSHDSSANSLTSIDAHFKGPEGTVYANGVFKIKIHIPERYPFQPPIVTFATPIYHPNIDNGGRICLDILNLPPKGTWQPSLNISTVLTSIGLLLSEPNPDDGLMHEASREYKYNRQAFDQNARSMTEKYARAGDSESGRGSHCSQTHTGPSTAQTENEGPEEPICTAKHFACSSSSRKLSLESLGSSTNRDSVDEIYKVPIHDYAKKHMETGQIKEAKKVVTEYNINPDILQTTRNKLSLKVPVVSHSRNNETANMNLPNQCSSLLKPQTVDSPETSPSVQVGNNHKLVTSCSFSVSREQQSLHYVKTSQSRDSSDKLHGLLQNDVSQLDSSRHNKTNPNKNSSAKDSTGPASVRHKKVGLGESTQSSGPLGYPQHNLDNGKENLAPNLCFPPQLKDQSAASPIISSVVSENGMYYNERMGKLAMKALKPSEMAAKLPFKPLDQLLGSNNNVIVHSNNPSSLMFDKKQQINEVHDRGDSTGTFKQCTESSPITEAVIVLDSEDSEEENVPVRSKLSLARRCLSRKRKSAI
ncbi:hypothetical protein BUALT_Bualt09G0018900 [Buddleja alternifolia]|uniref:E2 ubiquitin-conjugating enzyme n=1 Tax=Buddleja alternifolia TaxID=168488 RepID=A0AAV6X0Y3_9LAMI|nr:hypothetical protein BUALT_Bualt09G0018900 [Buddleja alternifolia]